MMKYISKVINYSLAVLILIFGVLQVGIAKYFTRYADNQIYQGKVDLDRYTGEWYQILETKPEIPLIMQFIFTFLKNVDKPCYNTKVKYTKENKEIFLRNECYVDGIKDRRIEITGTATPTNSDNTKLKVKFSPWYMRFTAFDYWIVDVDPTYSIAVLSSPASKGITILSRNPNPDTNLYKRALSIATNMGYDLTKSIKTSQEW
jgi:apolipoprotein D and lipocalin family protein